MAELAREYIDTKNFAHRVEHFILPMGDGTDKERIMDELLYALTKPNKYVTA